MDLSYESTENELSERILALIPSHPEILAMDDPWKLFKIEGFKCDDLQPSLAQACCALGNAKGKYTARSAQGAP